MAKPSQQDIAGRMRSEWLDRLERWTRFCQGLPPTGLHCFSDCAALCCPRVGMREMGAEEIASPVVILLPFEMEYLMAKTGLASDAFRLWPVEMAPGTTIEVGMFDLGKPCPYLRPTLRCGIYADRPVDCQTFPLLPMLDEGGQLVWSHAEHCPSLDSFNPEYADPVRRAWADLGRALPRGWWELYRAADDWLGWPPEAEESRDDR